MGLYSDQLATRIKMDSDSFDESFVHLASVVMGHAKQAENFLSDRETSKNAIEEILKYFHVIPAELPANIKSTEEQLEFFLRPSGIMRRVVNLTGEWYKDGFGPLLGKTKDGRVIALIPRKVSGYTFFDYTLGRRVKATRLNCKFIETEAFCFYKPLPIKKLNISDLLKYMVDSLAVSDYAMVISTTLFVTLLGMLIPYANRLIFGNVIASGDTSQLLSIATLLLGVTISTALINMSNLIIMAKINTKIEVFVQSASMARLLSLPASFFNEYSSGEMSQRLQSLNTLCSTLVQAVLSTGLTSVFSFIYVGQIVALTPKLAVTAILIIFANIAFTLLSALMAIKTSRKKMESSAKLSGFEFSLFSGIQKIKLAGAERRAFSKWADKYVKVARQTFTPPWIIRLTPVISSSISLFGTIILFAAAGTAKLTPEEYMAFNVTYGMVSGAIISLASIATVFSSIKPVLDMAKPILNTEPEISVSKKMISRLSGMIDINNISFRYNDDMPLIIDNLSLKINSGQYVAIVGASGCGKSTLLRILLGFEQPSKGAVYYDGRDMKSIDLKSLRRNIGCVIQNGKLMSASIYQNIALSAPSLTLAKAWEAAEMAGVADDIKAMPMGMHTVISEGGGGISGGQKQRLLIARAIAAKPKFIFLDEATSALDNITQRHVSESIDRLKCTRIVIAHRLSTIRQCDRIIMLEKGKIVEDGTYNELIALNGKFKELVEHQRLEG